MCICVCVCVCGHVHLFLHQSQTVCTETHFDKHTGKHGHTHTHTHLSVRTQAYTPHRRIRRHTQTLAPGNVADKLFAIPPLWIWAKGEVNLSALCWWWRTQHLLELTMTEGTGGIDSLLLAHLHLILNKNMCRKKTHWPFGTIYKIVCVNTTWFSELRVSESLCAWSDYSYVLLWIIS